MTEPIDPGADIGHVHLKVADIDRALDFYCGVLGFELHAAHGRRRGVRLRRRLSPPHRPQHLAVAGRLAAAAGTTGLFHTAIRYPTRRALADALERVRDAGIALDGASDHGVSEALYLRDPDQNGVELYWDRPERAVAARPRGPRRVRCSPPRSTSPTCSPSWTASYTRRSRGCSSVG